MRSFRSLLRSAIFCGFIAGWVLLPLLRAQSLDLPPRPIAPNDESQYHRFVLENGIKVLLVSDPKLNKSSAALVVGVGSLSDPPERQGLAHFLEHMLFLGTEKFPDAAEYGNYLRSNGGYSNAYTAGDHTNYHFEIRHEAFDGALDRFSQFFIAPRFTPEFTEREINAVNSENQMNLENDDRRQYQLASVFYRPDHPANHFATGNSETLKGTTQDELLTFYTQHYSANRMSLVLVGKAGLGELEAWARRFFAPVQNRDLPEARYPSDYLPPQPALRVATMEPIKDVREMSLEFPLPALRDEWATKSGDLAGFILGYEGEGSLLSALKREGLATALSAGAHAATVDYGTFFVGVELTAAGLEQRQRVLELFFSAVASMRRAGYPSYLFRERAAMARIDEMFQDRGEGAARASSLARQVFAYPLEVAEREPFLWLREDPAGYQQLLDHLRPDNLLVVVAAQGLPVDRTEKYYGTKYGYTAEAGPAFTALSQPPGIAGLHPPAPNPFIPERAVQLALQPVRLIDEPALSLYYLQDTEFARPMVAEVYRLRLPRKLANLRTSVLLDFYAACVNEALNEIVYTAGVAGLRASLTADLEGVVISLDGYDAGAGRLRDAVAAQLVDFQLDEGRFAAIKDRLVRGRANFPRADAWRILLETRRGIVREFHFRPDEQQPVAEKITLADVRTFARQLYREGRIEALISGNVTAAEAVAGARRLASTMRTRPVADAQILRRRLFVQAPGTATLTSEQLLVNNSSFRLEYTLGADTPEMRAASLVLASFIAEPFYSEMRTRQQLGYIVSGGAGNEQATQFAYFIIQSGDYAADELAARAGAFVATLPEQLAALSDDAWAMIVAGARAELEEKDKAIAERAARLFALAYDYAGDWNRRESTLAALDSLTRERTREILATALDPATARQRTFLGFAREHKPASEIKPTIRDRAAWKKQQTYR